MSRSVVPFRVLSRTNLAYTPDTPALSPFVSEICGLFNSLGALFATPVVCFLQLADSFCKTPGVGGHRVCVATGSCGHISSPGILPTTICWAQRPRKFGCHTDSHPPRSSFHDGSPILE